MINKDKKTKQSGKFILLGLVKGSKRVLVEQKTRMWSIFGF